MILIVLLVIFAWWVASFVHLDRVAFTYGREPAAMQTAGWSCFWATCALFVAVLVVL